MFARITGTVTSPRFLPGIATPPGHASPVHSTARPADPARHRPRAPFRRRPTVAALAAPAMLVALTALVTFASTLACLYAARPAWAANTPAGDGGGGADVAPWPCDPWYRDVHGHWAEGYIRVLWEEGVADGYVARSPIPGLARLARATFRPDSAVSRGELAVLLARAFRVAPVPAPGSLFADVPRDYCEYGDKPAAGYIEGARDAGLVQPVGERLFAPAQPVARQEVVAALVAGLDLGEWADRLTAADIDDALGKFRDRIGIAAEYRRAMALAVRLRIVEGYPDRTVRPGRMLSRAEAATLTYRCCMARITAAPDPFSPDGDGIDETTHIRVITSRNRNVRAWLVTVEGWLAAQGTRGPQQGVIYRTFRGGPGGPVAPAGPGDPHEPPPLAWDGRDDAGGPLPAGVYMIRARVFDRYGQAFDAVPRPVLLVRHGLEARLVPPFALPGQRVAVLATTTGGATDVVASPPWGPATSLYPHGGVGSWPGGPAVEGWLALVAPAAWRGDLELPATLLPGTYEVPVTAAFPGTTRTVTLRLEVFQTLVLDGRLFPNPARPGEAVTIEASTSPAADGVTALLPDGLEVAMAYVDDGLTGNGGADDGGAEAGDIPSDVLGDRAAGACWRLTFTVAPGTRPGDYDVVLTARWRDQERCLVLGLGVINSDGLAAVRTVLSD